jgi:hypothetical protein
MIFLIRFLQPQNATPEETATLATCSRPERLCPRRVDRRCISDLIEEEKMPAIIALGGGIHRISHMHGCTEKTGRPCGRLTKRATCCAALKRAVDASKAKGSDEDYR